MSLLTIFRRPALRPHAPYSAISPRPSVLKTILAAAPLKPAPRNRPEQSALLQSLGLTPVPQPEETIAPIETAHLLAGYPLSYYDRPNSEAESPAVAAGAPPDYRNSRPAQLTAALQQVAQLTATIADLQNRLRWSHDREKSLRADLHRSQERLPLPANVIPFTPARAKSPRPAA
jgi:hypothetical protein